MFKINRKSKISKARAGTIKTPHGDVSTPLFMPDATRGYIKLTDNEELKGSGIKAMVVNTFHLLLQPGMKIIKKNGGIHDFMKWEAPLLSDSGGFQVFSLIRQKKGNKPLGRVLDEKVEFKSPIDGSLHELTPEKSIQIQFDLGVDMMVCLDDCPPNEFSDREMEKSVERTIIWAYRCKKEFEKQIKKRKLTSKKRPKLFSVIQGGKSKEMRRKCAEGLVAIGFDGYGFGARPVDEDGNFLGEILQFTADLIPDDSLKFALGIGSPEDIVRCSEMGWDMFDCVIPTREGRHGKLFYFKDSALEWEKRKNKKTKKSFYKTINISNAKFAKDTSPINADSKIKELREYSKSYLYHLFKTKEQLGAKLASLNNLEFYMELMRRIRKDV